MKNPNYKKELLAEAIDGRKLVKCPFCGHDEFEKISVELVKVWESEDCISDDIESFKSCKYTCLNCNNMHKEISEI